jgi:uncharacterized repeat protein (TIGR01451 family)
MASRKRHAFRRGWGLLLASLFLGLLLSGLFSSLFSAAAQIPEPPAPLQVQIVSSPARPDEAAQALEEAAFWTDEMLRKAKPYPMPTGHSGLERLPGAPDGPAGWAPSVPPEEAGRGEAVTGLAGRVNAAPEDGTYFNPNSYTLFPFRAVGRVFFMIGADLYACSASVIGDYAIWTAGHCVHPGDGSPNGWYTHWIFIPAYKDNVRPYGTWPAYYTYTTDQWMNSQDVRYDYAVVIVKPLNGLTIRQTVGALGFTWNQALNQPRVAMGYPMDPQPDFNGERQVVTSAASAFSDTNQLSPYPIGIVSRMQFGASGGPWMLNHAIDNNPAHNLLNGNSSYLYTGHDYIFSPYFGEVAKTMYLCAAQSTPTHRTCGNEADLAVTQSARRWVLPGQAFTYTIAVLNQGALDANHLVLTDTIGLGASFITASLPGGNCTRLGQQVSCTLAFIPRWTTISATLVVSSPLQSGTTVNLAGAHSDQNDFSTQDNARVAYSVAVGTPTFLPMIGK